MRKGLTIPAARYAEATRVVTDSRATMAEIYKATPVVLVPAATGVAL